MHKLTILMGIGFMLVGALAYALPQEQEAITLLPALVGLIMAVGSLFCQKSDVIKRHVMTINAVASGILIVICATRIVPDWIKVEMGGSNLGLIADLNVLCLSVAFLTMALSSLVEGQRKVEARLY